MQVSANKPIVKLDDIIETLKITHPEKTGKWSLLLPEYGNAYIWAEYPKPPEKADELYAPFRVLFHPYTGEVVAEHYWGETLWSLVYEVHATLLMGKFGGVNIGKFTFNIICFFGLFLCISTLTGLYLWMPRWNKIKSALTIKRHTSIERFCFDLHKTVGFYSTVILLILAFTGFSFAYADYIKPVIRYFSSVRIEHLKDPELKSSIINTSPISISTALSIADDIFPTAKLRGLFTPNGKDGVYEIDKMQAGEANHRWARSKVWIDQYSGKVLAIQDPMQFTAGETFLNVMWPLHSGEALGFIGRLLWCVAGFAPLMLYVTGIIRWLQKRVIQKLINF